MAAAFQAAAPRLGHFGINGVFGTLRARSPCPSAATRPQHVQPAGTQNSNALKMSRGARGLPGAAAFDGPTRPRRKRVSCEVVAPDAARPRQNNFRPSRGLCDFHPARRSRHGLERDSPSVFIRRQSHYFAADRTRGRLSAPDRPREIFVPARKCLRARRKTPIWPSSSSRRRPRFRASSRTRRRTRRTSLWNSHAIRVRERMAKWPET